ncbi:MAG: pyruvate, phosphate dikinase [Pseudomonadota bacterium]
MKADTARIGWIGAGHSPLPAVIYGTKAAWLSEAAALGLPVPPGFALPAEMLGELDLVAELDALAAQTGTRLGDPSAPLLLALRASSDEGASASVPAVLNIGICDAVFPALVTALDLRVAQDLRRRLIQSYGIGALGMEGEEFEYALYDALKDAGADAEEELSADALAELTERCLNLVAAETGEPFPDAADQQLSGALNAMAAAWNTPRARRRRVARGGADDAPLTLIVQQMVLGLGAGNSGAGIAHLRDPDTGVWALSGRYLANAQGDEALMGLRTPQVLSKAEREEKRLPDPALEEVCPQTAHALADAGARIEAALGDAFSLDFTLANGDLHLLELHSARLSSRAAVQVAVDLAESGAITREDALMRIDPVLLDAHLHPMIDPSAKRDQIGQGLPASPGAASGPLVFSPGAAEEAAATGNPALLALIETSPEDIRGMHAASGVLTVRGGMTSHAAVVARGLGTPCVVGAGDLTLDVIARQLTAADGRVFREGDVVTVVGGEGQVLAGAVPTLQPEITGAFATLMDWADQVRTMGVRANADTARDADIALGFAARGIGLCRTEHMFFKDGHLTTMRQMILAESEAERRTALEKLLPMQRADFVELFEAIHGLPVVIRLLDPPLHEFLPHGLAEMEEIAAELAVPVEKIRARALDLAEFNPMLGKRGCRIGIAFPEIYEMQARAIFEAACEAGARTGAPVKPEIMIPLVSAVRELELLKTLIEESAEAVRTARNEMVDYTIGVMIETPRACLRAGDIADKADFLSFGTNDLTQMLYGLSRDDAGRFMPDYVAREVFPHDPFHRIDEEGVGEIIRLAIERARAAMPGVSIGLCGEHGGDPASVDFCQRAGFDYVSCSPFRVPIARLAAAQAAIRARR